MGNKYKCKYTFYDTAYGSKNSKQSAACQGTVDGLNTAGLSDDNGDAYKASAYYSGDGHCQLFFTKSDCGSTNGYFPDSSHASIQTYNIKCKTD